MHSTGDTFSGLRTPQQTPNSDLVLIQHKYISAQQKLQSSASQESNRSRPVTFKNSFPEFKCGESHIHDRGAPLFEVASIRIDSDKFKEFDAINIYGTILLIDDLGNEFYIFDCKHHEAKTLILDPETPTSVILQNFQPRGLPSEFCLLFQLKRRMHGATEEDIVIFDDYKYICCTDKVVYDKQQEVFFSDSKSEYMITVGYIIHQCALLAEVGVIVEKARKDGSEVAILSGDIVATNTLSNMSPCKRTLLSVSSEELDFGNYIPLSTLASPVYSSLEIRGQLSVNGLYVSDVLMFEPFTTPNVFHEKQIGSRPYRIRVIVFWKHGATGLPESNILEYHVRRSETPFTDQRPISKLLQSEHVGAYYIQPDVKKYLEGLEWDINYLFSNELMEIFSISVCIFGRDDSASSLKGKMICRDCIGCLTIFDSDIDGVASSSDFVKLVPDLGRGFVGPHLGIEIDLKDNQGREISFGTANYELPTRHLWRDRRICSVIRGQYGFAAVHYTIFSDAVVAKLSFEVVPQFISGGAAGFQVYGSINTWYSNFNYATHYAKKYYRNTLFEKRKRNVVNVGIGEKIPLSKSTVAVPLYASMIVEALVCVQTEKLREKLRFEGILYPKRGPVKLKVRGRKSFYLFVGVEWV